MTKVSREKGFMVSYYEQKFSTLKVLLLTICMYMTTYMYIRTYVYTYIMYVCIKPTNTHIAKLFVIHAYILNRTIQCWNVLYGM